MSEYHTLGAVPVRFEQRQDHIKRSNPDPGFIDPAIQCVARRGFPRKLCVFDNVPSQHITHPRTRRTLPVFNAMPESRHVSIQRKGEAVVKTTIEADDDLDDAEGDSDNEYLDYDLRSESEDEEDSNAASNLQHVGLEIESSQINYNLARNSQTQKRNRDKMFLSSLHQTLRRTPKADERRELYQWLTSFHATVEYYIEIQSYDDLQRILLMAARFARKTSHHFHAINVFMKKTQCVQCWMDACAPILGIFNAEELCMILYSLGVLQVQPSDLFLNSWYTACKDMTSFSAQSLSLSLWSHAAFRKPLPERFLKVWLQEFEKRSFEFNEQSLTTTLWSFATVGTPPGPTLVGIWERRFRSKWALFCQHHIASIFWSFGRLGLIPEPSTLRRLVAAFIAVESRMSPQSLARCLSGFVAFGVQPTDVFISCWMKQFFRKLKHFDLDELIVALDAITRLKIPLKHSEWRRLSAVVRSFTNIMDASEFCTVIRLYAAWNRAPSHSDIWAWNTVFSTQYVHFSMDQLVRCVSDFFKIQYLPNPEFMSCWMEAYCKNMEQLLMMDGCMPGLTSASEGALVVDVDDEQNDDYSRAAVRRQSISSFVPHMLDHANDDTDLHQIECAINSVLHISWLGKSAMSAEYWKAWKAAFIAYGHSLSSDTLFQMLTVVSGIDANLSDAFAYAWSENFAQSVVRDEGRPATAKLSLKQWILILRYLSMFTTKTLSDKFFQLFYEAFRDSGTTATVHQLEQIVGLLNHFSDFAVDPQFVATWWSCYNAVGASHGNGRPRDESVGSGLPNWSLKDVKRLTNQPQCHHDKWP